MRGATIAPEPIGRGVVKAVGRDRVKGRVVGRSQRVGDVRIKHGAVSRADNVHLPGGMVKIACPIGIEIPIHTIDNPDPPAV